MQLLNKHTIKQLIELDVAAPLIEQAYRDFSAGKFDQPPVGHLAFPGARGDCHIKYGYLRGDSVFVIKVATGFTDNPASAMPIGNGASLVLSATHGHILAVLHDEMYLTDIRTAVGGAIASRRLARAGASKLLVVGSGTQARLQAKAHLDMMPGLQKVTIWARDANKSASVAAALARPSCVVVSEDLRAACDHADVIVTTTAASKAIIATDWISPGTHITAVGADAPGKQELDQALIERADVLVADSRTQCLDHGEFGRMRASALVAKVTELGLVLSGQVEGRNAESQITIADLTGIAAQDIAIAKHVLERRAVSGGDPSHGVVATPELASRSE